MRMTETASDIGYETVKIYELARENTKWKFRLHTYYHLEKGERVYRVKDNTIVRGDWIDNQITVGGPTLNELQELSWSFHEFGDPVIQTKLNEAYDLRIAAQARRAG